MKAKRKGSRQELKSIKLLEAAGFYFVLCAEKN